MKTILALLCGLVLGVAAGSVGALRWCAKEVYEANVANIQESFRHHEQESLTLHNNYLMVLTLIEGGEHEKLKSVLARALASYYRTFRDAQPEREGTRKLVEDIQAASEKLPSLKQALETPPK